MNRNSKKGFTIVELIIVIAVIAVLAAVLIPTFSNLIKKANEAKDTALVSNLNKGLKMSSKDFATMHEALQAVEENVVGQRQQLLCLFEERRHQADLHPRQSKDHCCRQRTIQILANC